MRVGCDDDAGPPPRFTFRSGGGYGESEVGGGRAAEVAWSGDDLFSRCATGSVLQVVAFYIYSHASYLDHGETQNRFPVHCPARRRLAVAPPTPPP